VTDLIGFFQGKKIFQGIAPFALFAPFALLISQNNRATQKALMSSDTL
jgi:hypothetical protein